jgi:excinuclease UvrABC nuclease subunit
VKKIKPYIPGPRFKVTGGIYLITCTETKDTYVGKSKNLNQRWCQHRTDLKKGSHKNPHIQKLYDTYGPNSLTMELIELVEDPNDLETREVYYINTLSPNLNVVATKLSRNDVDRIKLEVDYISLKEVCKKYNLTLKYLKEILRGGRWH